MTPRTGFDSGRRLLTTRMLGGSLLLGLGIVPSSASANGSALNSLISEATSYQQYFRPESVSPIPTQSVPATAEWFKAGIDFLAQARIRTLERVRMNDTIDASSAIQRKPFEAPYEQLTILHIDTSYGAARKAVTLTSEITGPDQHVTPWYVLNKYSQEVRPTDFRGSYAGGLLVEVAGIRNWYIPLDPQRRTKAKNGYSWLLFAGPRDVIDVVGGRLKPRPITAKELKTRQFFLWKNHPGFIQTDLVDTSPLVTAKASLPKYAEQLAALLTEHQTCPPALLIAYDLVEKYSAMH